MDEGCRKFIKEIAQGDKESLRQFFIQYGASIKSTAYRVLSDTALCDDVLNSVLLKIWESAAQIKDYSNILGYIYTVTYNLAIDFKRKRREVFFENGNFLNADYNSGENYGSEKMYIDGILESIDEPMRSILILKAYGGYSFFEIARIKKISYKQARNYYLKASKLFEELYKKQDDRKT